MEGTVHVRTARDLGAAIKQARKERGFSQTALAREIGVHQPKISAVERGAPGVRVGLVLQILRTLNLVIAVEPSRADPRPKKQRSKGAVDYVVDLDAIANTGLKR